MIMLIQSEAPNVRSYTNGTDGPFIRTDNQGKWVRLTYYMGALLKKKFFLNV